MREIQLKRVYRHFKGDCYLVEDLARHSETGEEYVVYRKLYGDGSLWIRPKAMFLEPVDRGKYPDADQEYRFELLEIQSRAGHEDCRRRSVNNNGFEIERKFLIAMPERAVLDAAERSEIVQTYLLGEKGTTERVRRRDRNGRIEYTHTVKRRISALRRVEEESEIGAAEYEALLGRADPKRQPVLKKRYCFVESGLLWEIDVYPFWSDRAIMEVELTDEAQEITLPQRIRILREVTDDKRYTNAAMSLSIPAEVDMDETKPAAFRLTDERN